MELDTVLVMVGLVMATNAPFYVMSLQNYRLLSWIRGNCPACIRRGKTGGENDG
jgi:hypothetical protein